MAADIETLIRQALARHNGFDPEIRSRIYQSTRNALAKMIARSGVLPPDVIENRHRALEDTIHKIELEFTSQAQPASEPDIAGSTAGISDDAASLSIPPSLEPVTTAVNNPVISPPEISNPEPAVQTPPDTLVSPQVELQTGMPIAPTPVAAAQYSEATPEYARPKPKPFRYLVWLIAAAIVLIVGWVIYTATVQFFEPQSAGSSGTQASQQRSNTDSGKFVTILEPAQTGALVTAGNGVAEIMTDTTDPAIRIMSVRQEDARDEQSGPMLLELAPGILSSIAGKKVTVEILAKSGDGGPAIFTVACDFGELGDCGRKRFRIGLQPEAIVFSIEISADYNESQRAFLAINTDVTKAAARTGNGARIDILYARIRLPE